MLQAFSRAAILAGLLLWSVPGEARLIAVVVGVSEYADPRLARAALPGASIDAAAIATALRAWGAVPSDVTLIDGKRADAATIRAAISRVAAGAAAGDRVVLYLAGHGAQVPARGGDRSEPDGLDEVFLAADAAPWDGARKLLPGSIRDDEFGGWIDRLRARGASVWFVVDACNGGGLQRGGGGAARARAIDPALLAIPAPTRGARADATGLADATPLQGGAKLVTFYAAPAGGIAWERPLASGDGGTIRRGVFTWTLLQALDAVRGDGSFLALADAADTTRRRLGPPGGPAWIGGDLDQPVLFWGGGSDLLAQARAAPSPPVALRIAIGPAGRGCPSADPDKAALAVPPATLRIRGCRRVLVELRSTAAAALTMRPWYRDAAGGYVALAGVAGVSVAAGAAARFAFTVMDRDPDTGATLPSGTEYLLLIADRYAGGAGGAIVVPLTTGG